MTLTGATIASSIISMSVAPASAAPPTIGGAGTFEYLEADPPISIGGSLTVADGVAYAGEYLEFRVGSQTGSEVLSLASNGSPVSTNGVVSLVGGNVYLGNGTVAENIGVVDAVRNGQSGQPLRVNFTNAFSNPGFETADLSSWTALNQRVDLGTTSIAGCPTVDSTTYAANTPNADNNVPANPGSYTTAVDSTQSSSGTYSLRLLSTGITTASGYDVVHGPAAFSSPFEAAAGDTIYFDWRAQAGNDAEHVFGYIINTSTCAQVEVLDHVGANASGSTPWATVSTVIPATGSYRFVFVSGTYDFTGGKAAGASMYIDNVRVYGTKATDDVAQQLARRIQYANTSLDAPASRTVTLTARNSAGEQGTANITVNLTPLPEAPVYLDDTLAPFRHGVAYNDAVTTRAWPYATYSTSGTLPTGVTFDPATATFSGTPSVAEEAYGFTVHATNDSGTNPRTYSGGVHTAPQAFTDTDTGQFLVGHVHSDRISASGIPNPTFSVVSGNLPAGIALSSATGDLTGTPTTAGPYTFTVRAANAEGHLDHVFTGNVYSVPSFTDQTLATFVTDAAYNDGVTAAGVPTPTYAITAGALPSGLTLNTATGAVTGTPSAHEAPYSFTITAGNVAGTAVRAFSGTVNSAPRAFVDSTLAQPYVGMPYTDGVVANGFPAPTYSVTSGALPAGLALNTSTGALTGTPTTGGPFSFEVTATNTAGTTAATFHGNVYGVPAFADDTVGTFLAGAPFIDGVFALGVPTPTYAVTAGTLPAGITLDVNTGALTGTPTSAAAPYAFTITASNVAGTDVRSYSGHVETEPSDYTDSDIGQLVVGHAHSNGVAANGMQLPTYAVTSGQLPAGMVLDGATGAITGTPTTTGAYSFWVTAANAHGSISMRIAGVVASDVQLTDQVIGDVHAGQPFSNGVAATGFPAPTYSVTSGALPAGLALNGTTGAITGTATQPDTAYDVTITVANLAGSVDIHLAGNVHAAPRGFAGTELAQLTAGEPFAGGVAANGFPAPTYAVTAGDLPAGLALDPVTGAITGVPANGGPYSFEITATNSHGATTRSFTGSVADVPTFTDRHVAQLVTGRALDDGVAAVGHPTVTYRISAGALPAGLVLDRATGRMTGTPLRVGPYTVTITATTIAGSADVTLTGSVAALPATTPTTPLGVLVEGEPVTASVAVAAQPAPTYAVTAGELPAGLTLDPVTGAITGTPLAAGPFSFTVSATNVAGSTSASYAGNVSTVHGGYVGLNPGRVLDTRGVEPLPAGDVLEIDVRGRFGVPADARGVVLNVAVTEPLADGFVTVYPCGARRPLAANVNFVRGAITSNSVMATVGASGKVCIYTTATANVVVDVNGAYSPSSGYGQLAPMVPHRLLDTRETAGRVAAGSITRVPVRTASGIPGDAAAVVLNVTAVDSSAAGFVTAYPCGAERPMASSLNFAADATVPNAVTAAIGSEGEVCLYASVATHLVVDINAAYSPTAATRFQGAVPYRVLDTRSGGRPGMGSVLVLDVDDITDAPAGTTALALNLAVDAPAAAGFVTVYPCAGGRPLAANANYVAGATVSNSVTVSLDDDGRVCVYTMSAAHVVVDVNGHYTR